MSQTESKNNSLGELFVIARKEARISLDEAAQTLRIPRRVLESLEAGEYEKLPPEAFSRGIVAKYAGLLKLDRAEMVALYEGEKNSLSAGLRSGPKDILPPNRFSSKLTWWGFGMKEFTIVATIAAFVYLFWQFGGFLQPPLLVIEWPVDAITFSQANILTVSGVVHGTNRVSVNNQRISAGQDGRFQAVIELGEGENLIEVSAENARGKTSTNVRRVFYQPPQPTPTPPQEEVLDAQE